MGEAEKAEKRRRKKEARAARRAAETAAPEARAVLPTPANIEEAIDQVYSAARSSQVDELSDEVMSYLDHIHADLMAILAHLGIERPACQDVDEAYAEEE